MTRDEQEMTLWCEAYAHACSQDWAGGASASIADRAVAEFRKRYPPSPPSSQPSPQQSEAWYDKPPFNDVATRYMWVQGKGWPCMVGWIAGEWQYKESGCAWSPLSGRRVSPITKPPEPTA